MTLRAPSFACLSCLLLLASHVDAQTFDDDIQQSKPVAHWSFNELPSTIGEAHLVDGPRAPRYERFAADNSAIHFERGAFAHVADEGDHSRFDFDNGDEITIEALVNPMSLGTHAYILGKGRTHNAGFAVDNQNWAFRLRNVDGEARLNFLFRSRDEDQSTGDWHRWTSAQGFTADSGWHHVAITYHFGHPETIQGFLDGKPLDGSWDMGGPTSRPPVVDNDEVVIGSAMKGNRDNSFHGVMDEIALYRRVLPPEELRKRFEWVEPETVLPEPLPGVVNLSLHGPEPSDSSFRFDPGAALLTWQQPWMGFVRIPRQFDDWGVRADWGQGMMVRAVSEVTLEPGEYELLGRSRSLSRLWVDGEMLLTFPRQKRGSGAHHEVQPVPEVPRPGMRPHAMDDVEKRTTFFSPGGTHTVVFDVMVGGPKLRLEFGETCVAIARQGEMFRLLGPEPGPELTDEGWLEFVDQQATALNELDRQRRRAADQQRPYWDRRHALAAEQLVKNSASQKLSVDQLIQQRLESAAANASNSQSLYHQEVEPILAKHCYRCHGEKQQGDLNLQRREAMLVGGESGRPAVVPGKPEESQLLELVALDAEYRMPPKGNRLTENEIHILTRWIEEGAVVDHRPADVPTPPEVVDDLTFLRRVWIDLVGVTPPVEVSRAFVNDSLPGKRDRMIAALLDDERWADNWMGYWQDVLAENPNLLKPNLNNTGPFRYWILESLRDNKPIDRFATELISLRGSTWGGGAAGFGVASQNDVPMAAKAHILGTAFLGVQMKCARCHDSPYHQTTQQDLFELAAMLRREEITVPESSSVPAAFFEHQAHGGRTPLIDVTLTIGATVSPEWPFSDLQAELPADILQDPSDLREQLAARVTFSRRFAEVMANRVWARLMGKGIVEPVDDWEGNPPSDPHLLSYLADELIRREYDLKSLTKLIVSSDAYQRHAVDPPPLDAADSRFFEGPYRRRMTAEQIVDSAWHAAGQSMDVGALTMDIEGRLAPDFFMNFGHPSHAWEFTTLANERDRPSLAMPRAQAVIDVLLAFGWRNSRQEPTSERMEEPNPLQPGVLANGVMGNWLTRLTDESEITMMSLQAETVDTFVDDLYLRFLTRFPTDSERHRFVELLAEGFDERLVPEDQVLPPAARERIPYVSWSNHLSSDANRIKQQQEEAARRGDPPTRFLRDEWRSRAEDAVWALLNSPEMIWVP